MTPRAAALLAQEAYTAAPDLGAAVSASRAIVRHTASDGLCIAFPGTNDLACVGADMDILTLDIPGIGRVHRGFWLAWNALIAPVAAAAGNAPVTFIGHSLGAALALLAAITRWHDGLPVAGVYGFEPPRISPHVLKLGDPSVVYLTKNGNDVIPDLPLEWSHPVPLRTVGRAAWPVPNITDHLLTNVLASLP